MREPRSDMTGDDARGRPAGPVGPARWGPASWWRIGLVALLGLIVLLLVMGGGFWYAEPVDVPR